MAFPNVLSLKVYDTMINFGDEVRNDSITQNG